MLSSLRSRNQVLMLQIQNLKVNQKKKLWNGYSQENLIEFLVQNCLSYIWYSTINLF